MNVRAVFNKTNVEAIRKESDSRIKLAANNICECVRPIM